MKNAETGFAYYCASGQGGPTLAEGLGRMALPGQLLRGSRKLGSTVRGHCGEVCWGRFIIGRAYEYPSLLDQALPGVERLRTMPSESSSWRLDLGRRQCSIAYSCHRCPAYRANFEAYEWPIGTVCHTQPLLG